jgi:DNA gyrase subunit A
MATNMPPHNLGEVADALCMVIRKPDVEIAELLQVLKGPDFPTGGIIYGIGGIVEACQTGRGSITVRARTSVEEREKAGRSQIIVTELPYMVNKATLVESIAELVRDKKLEGISDIRDESDRDGMRVVIELKKDALGDVVLNQLFKHTSMEQTFGVINLALVDGKPLVLTLKQLLQLYLEHRRVIVARRTAFDLRKAQERAHILEGLLVALDHLDEVISLIRASRTPEEARNGLISRFGLSEIQAREILDTRLQRLTGMERENIKGEFEGLLREIESLKGILADKGKIEEVIQCEILKLKEDYADVRRTEIVYETADLDIEDLIPNTEIIITVTQNDYIKRQPLDTYRQQKRGGKGLVGIETREEDVVVDVFTTRAHNYLLFFTSKGKVHWLKAYRIPEGVRHARGRPVVNMLPALEPGEVIQFIIPVGEFDDKHWVVFSTTHGVIKKTELSAYGNPRSTGIIALLLDEGDSVISAALSDGTHEVALATRGGMAVRFKESDVRPMGRAARGVRGITLDEGDSVVSMALVFPESALLTITENGFGKRSLVSEYRKTRRGGKGVITINTDERNGPVVAVIEVSESDELIATSQRGKVIRMPVRDIPVQGRNTMGVRLMRLEPADKVIGVDRIVPVAVNGIGVAQEPPGELPPGEQAPVGCKCDSADLSTSPTKDTPPSQPASQSPDPQEPSDRPTGG